MAVDLFPYQAIGAKFLSERKRALLADEMGLGKSAQAITACDLVAARNILIVCPAVARMNWAAEFETFSVFGRPVQVVFTANGFKAIPEGIVIVSYDLVETLYEELTSRKWDVVIADEAHFLKNPKAKRTKAVYGEPRKERGLIQFAKHFWSLSGTPAPNNYAEMWPIMRSFGLTQLSFLDFVERYTVCRNTPFGLQIIRGKNSNELKELLTPIMLRRKKEQVLTQLPPITFADVVVEPGHVDDDIWFMNTSGQPDPELHNTLAKQEDVAKHLIGHEFSAQAFDTLMAAAKPLATLRRYQGMQKVDPTVALVEEMIEQGVNKVVLFAVHRDVIMLLDSKLKKYKPQVLFGGTPGEKRAGKVTKFQNNPACKVFIGQVQAAGTAITLTSAHRVLFVEASWVPAENAQAAMRCHRIGQTKHVLVQFVALANSLDQKIQRAIKRKTRDLTELFD